MPPFPLGSVPVVDASVLSVIGPHSVEENVDIFRLVLVPMSARRLRHLLLVFLSLVKARKQLLFPVFAGQLNVMTLQEELWEIFPCRLF